MGKQLNTFALENVCGLRQVEDHWTINELEGFCKGAKRRGAEYITYTKSAPLSYQFSGLSAWKKETEEERLSKRIEKKRAELKELEELSLEKGITNERH